MLNVMVAQHNTNDQYQTLVDAARGTYETSSQMSIEFEVDGPYKVRRSGGSTLRALGAAQRQTLPLFARIGGAAQCVCARIACHQRACIV